MLPEAQKGIIDEMLKMTEFLAAPMLADTMWWKSKGKFEWTDIVFEVDAILEKKLAAKDEEFCKVKTDFESKLKEINESIKTDAPAAGTTE